MSGKKCSGGDDINTVWLDPHAVDCLLHPHRRAAGEQFDHHARMRRIEMLDHDEGHVAVGRRNVEELPEGIETAGRSADGDHGKSAKLGRASCRERVWQYV